MESNVNESAARLRRLANDERSRDVYPTGDIANAHARDLMRVADAYLAEHPSDENGFVTREWLESIGFTPGRFPEDLKLGPVVCGVTPAGKPYWIVRTYPLPDGSIVTRGDLRSLLAALKIGWQE